MILLILKSNQCFLLTFFMRKMGLWALNFDGHRCHRSIEPGSDMRSEFTGKGKLILPLLELFLTPPPFCLMFHLSPPSDPEMDHTPPAEDSAALPTTLFPPQWVPLCQGAVGAWKVLLFPPASWTGVHRANPVSAARLRLSKRAAYQEWLLLNLGGPHIPFKLFLTVSSSV